MREILENDYIPSDDYYFVTFEEDREWFNDTCLSNMWKENVFR
jgi:hypothetical protein